MTATAEATATPASAPTGAGEPTAEGQPAALSVDADGVVAINWEALRGEPFFDPPVGGSADPFYHIHTMPNVDGFFFSIEAYTTGYGPAWTGELGTFAIDCSINGSGICVYFDPDGPGPIPVAGQGFDATGEITFHALSDEGYDLTLTDVAFSEGYTIPGPIRISGP